MKILPDTYIGHDSAFGNAEFEVGNHYKQQIINIAKSFGWKEEQMRYKCPKCGSIEILMRYSNDRDILMVKCSTCEYKWEEQPLDYSHEVEKTIDKLDDQRK